MTKKSNKALRVVETRYLPTPDADRRLSQTIDLLLSSAAKHTKALAPNVERETPPQALTEGALTGGEEGGRDGK